MTALPPSTYLVSVPRTGTRFLREIIQPDEFRHVWSPDAGKLLDSADVVAAPIRDPLTTWNTWRSYDKREGPALMEMFRQAWSKLDSFASRRSIHIVPVDVPVWRDDALAGLGKALGRKLTTDWNPVGSFAGLRAPHEEPDLSYVYSLPVVERSYRHSALSKAPVLAG